MRLWHRSASDSDTFYVTLAPSLTVYQAISSQLDSGIFENRNVSLAIRSAPERAGARKMRSGRVRSREIDPHNIVLPRDHAVSPSRPTHGTIPCLRFLPILVQ
jgi:hypothetical protein